VVFKFKPSSLRFEHDGKVLSDEFPQNSYDIGDRIGQIIIMPYPQIEFNLVDELSTTDRGVGGFGSTDEDAELNAIADSRKGQKRISVNIEDL
jgi:hypothetical protein